MLYYLLAFSVAWVLANKAAITWSGWVYLLLAVFCIAVCGLALTVLSVVLSTQGVAYVGPAGGPVFWLGGLIGLWSGSRARKSIQ